MYSISVLPSSELNKSFDDKSISEGDSRAQSLDKELQDEINQEDLEQQAERARKISLRRKSKLRKSAVGSMSMILDDSYLS